jgi:hypothetical protein
MTTPGAAGDGTTSLVGCVRLGLAAAGAIGLVFGVFIALNADAAGGLWVAVLSGGLLAIVLYERMRYRTRSGREVGDASTSPADAAPPAGYERTDEVFTDPTTGERLRVWYHPATGDRRYIPEP